MSDKTGIEWADSTFNPWIGCTKVSPGCDHCYAERDTRRFGRVQWGTGQPRVRTSEANWKKPLQWNRRPFFECKECGWRGDEIGHDWIDTKTCPACEQHALKPVRRRVFCASLADVFDNEVDPAWRADLFSLIEQTPNLDWMLLTKRIGNVTRMVEEATDLIDYGEGWQSMWGQGKWPENVWIGATICNQEEAYRDIPKLLAFPAIVRFLSIEPMLGRIDLCETFGMWWNQTMQCFEANSSVGFNRNPRNHADKAIDWVIVGGESGPNARPMHPAWVRSLRDQCAAAGVPLLFKQWGEWMPAENEDGKIVLRFKVGDPTGPQQPKFHEWDGGAFSARVGKRAAGRLLDGVQHDGYPKGGAA